MTKIDIHNFKRRLELVELGIARLPIARKDRKVILEYRDQMFADGLGLTRVVKYLVSIKRMYDLAPAGLWRARKSALISLLARIERSEWKAWTKHDHKLAIRKYLSYCGKLDLAQLVRLSKVHGYKLPEELLDQEDIQALLDVAGDEQYRAFLYCLYESGCRIGELLSLQRKHIRYDAQGIILTVDGKTGMRRVRLLESAPALDVWISCDVLEARGPYIPKHVSGIRKAPQDTRDPCRHRETRVSAPVQAFTRYGPGLLSHRSSAMRVHGLDYRISNAAHLRPSGRA